MDNQEYQLVENFLDTRSEMTFRKLYRTYTPSLYALSLRFCAQDKSMAEELVQETWLLAIQKLPVFEWRSSLKTWLTGILINLNRQKYRKNSVERAYQQAFEQDQASQKPVTSIDWEIQSIDLENAIASLPVGYRQILVLHDVEGYTHQEIGELLAINPGTSKSQLFQARKTIRNYLSDLKKEGTNDG